ncbi:MAG: DNA polymerase III subunit alpha [Proteobacteria bacterium]|nr:DNA polymerase III subunit alpha [Pseudomonadota bacterium]
MDSANFSKFVHLRCRSEFSIRDGLLRIKPWLEQARQLKMPAIALTDRCNLFGLIKFYKAAISQKIKPIIGADFLLASDGELFEMTLLCQNQTGYLNVIQLISLAYIKGQTNEGHPSIQWQWLEQYHSGLIVLSGGRNGDIGQALLKHNSDLAKKRLQKWIDIFPGCFYLELQRTGRPQEEVYNEQAISLAGQFSIPVVATNEVCFLNKEDFHAHEARTCIHSGRILADPQRVKLYSEQQYLRSIEDMTELFADIPEALANSVYIAQRCNVFLKLGEVHLPKFPLQNNQSENDYFVAQAQQGLMQRLEKGKVAQEKLAEYNQRLQQELSVINRMGFAGYFLIVADFIRWAKEQGIPVGPGRGSGAGSLVAYALEITELDPIVHELLFERFLNPERVSMPDFDIDFCMEGRDRVIDYVGQRYGSEAVSQIITFGTMAAKAVVRDVGRVLGMPYGFVDKVAKLIPFELGMTLEKALAEEPQLAERYQKEEEVAGLINLARKLEGITRNAGKHAGGVVIAPTRLVDFTPLYCEPGGDHPVTQFDKDDVESAGLVKFDFLGLRTLTIIDWALKAINKNIDINQIPLDDAKTYHLLPRSTTAIFQLESRGMKELVRRLQPNVFEEITALVALFRPGPLQSGMVDDFVARKHGQAKVEYPHPDLEPILKNTYGVILYQEQVMQIAQTLSGYSLGEADILRRAMGKKKPEEMYKQREKFVNGAKSRGIAAKTAEYIFDLMEKFAGYGFNKSHSAAYAVLTYQTAWLKTHYPAEFMAAVLSSDMDNTDKVVNFLGECRLMELKVLPPNINVGQYMFTVNASGAIEYGLGAIKGVGFAVIDHLVSERKQNGLYQNLFDLCRRLDSHKLTRRVLEPLIRSGALDMFGQERANLMASIDVALKAAEQFHNNLNIGQSDLFAEMVDSAQEDYVRVSPWPFRDRLLGEKQTLGFYISGHPLEIYQPELSQLRQIPIAKLEKGKQGIICAGILTRQKVIQTRKGARMAILTLEDLTGTIEVTVFSQLYDQVRASLIIDEVFVLRGSVEEDNYTSGLRLVAEALDSLTSIRNRFARRLKIQAVAGAYSDPEKISAIIQPFKGGRCEVVISYQKDQTNALIALGENWRVTPHDELFERLRQAGMDQFVVEY